MADNYLEKKMEDYRRGVTLKTPRRSMSLHNITGHILSVPYRRVALIIKNDSLLRAILALTQEIHEIKVAFVATDYRQGNSLAQAHGAMFAQVDDMASGSYENLFDAARRRWGGVDMIATDFDCLDGSVVDVPKILTFDFGNSVSPILSDASCVKVSIKIPSTDYDVNSVAQVFLNLLTSSAESVQSVSLAPMQNS